MDGIDAALVSFSGKRCTVHATHQQDLGSELAARLDACKRNPADCHPDELGSLDTLVGRRFADAASNLLAGADVSAQQVVAIGSHGQTLRHLPRATVPFTLQIGDPNIIAEQTSITTVADFRRRDLALGGEGAPLAPAFHHWLFAESSPNTVVLNLGGIANITILHPDSAMTLGFDTGPANTLSDGWISRCKTRPFDSDGQWARSGTIQQALLDTLLLDDYLARTPPKSTGFEHYNVQWLTEQAATVGGINSFSEEDVQATLAEFTAISIARAIAKYAPGTDRAVCCGGGVRNGYLMERLSHSAPEVSFRSSSDSGIDPDWMEAAAFAWLAMRTLAGLPGNLPSVTGASAATILGGIFPANAL